MVDDCLAIAKCGHESVEVNTFVNTQFEAKILSLNETKCKKIHVGNKSLICPTLHAHQEIISNESHEKYLVSS